MLNGSSRGTYRHVLAVFEAGTSGGYAQLVLAGWHAKKKMKKKKGKKKEKEKKKEKGKRKEKEKRKKEREGERERKKKREKKKGRKKNNAQRWAQVFLNTSRHTQKIARATGAWAPSKGRVCRRIRPSLSKSGQIPRIKRISFSRSQRSGCSTGHDTSIHTQVVCK